MRLLDCNVFFQFFRILNDSGTYIDSLRVELEYLTDQNVNETFNHIGKEITGWRSNIASIVDDTITQSPLKDVLVYVYFLGNVSTRFVENDQKKIVDSLRQISIDTGNVKNVVNEISNDSDKILGLCADDECRRITNRIQKVTNDIYHEIDNFSVIKKKADEIDDISLENSNANDFEIWIMESLKNFKHSMNESTFNEHLRQSRESLKEFVKKPVEILQNLHRSMNGKNEEFGTRVNTIFSTYLSEYFSYGYIIFLVLSLIIALVLLMACVGLLFGKDDEM